MLFLALLLFNAGMGIQLVTPWKRLGRLLMIGLARYGRDNGDFVLVGSQAASLRPTASRSWSRSSVMR